MEEMKLENTSNSTTTRDGIGAIKIPAESKQDGFHMIVEEINDSNIIRHMYLLLLLPTSLSIVLTILGVPIGCVFGTFNAGQNATELGAAIGASTGCGTGCITGGLLSWCFGMNDEVKKIIRDNEGGLCTQSCQTISVVADKCCGNTEEYEAASEPEPPQHQLMQLN